MKSTALLCGIFALSGAAALIFETLFFRIAGLALGNGVTAAAIVLFSFMAGLGLGNAFAARGLRRVARPLLLFAGLELCIALYGAALITLFPGLTAALAPLFRQLADAGPALDALRLAVASLLFALPAVAMGMTLPVLVGALSARDANFGRVLGRLYGWNTLGAVAGALLAERVLVSQLGVTGAGLAAAGLDVTAAGAVLWLRRTEGSDALTAQDLRGRAPAPDRAQLALLAAAFASGAILLALEVVWFRFFLLFTSALSWNLAVMLATVLSGIAAGGIAGARWLERDPEAYRGLGAVALTTGATAALVYTLFTLVWPRVPELGLVFGFVLLMLPVSFGSGLLFTLLGRALEARGLPPTVATGRLAVSNTAGSALGSLLGGFLLVPRVGIEVSLLGLALAYGAVALLANAALGGRSALRRPLALTALAAFVLAALTFPLGALQARLLPKPGGIRAHLEAQGYALAAYEEAVTETIQYFRKTLLGTDHHFALVTNDHAMASTELSNRRYMKAYAYWPLAIRPDAKDALLISYGVGGTAQALATTPTLERIDVVDISSAILAMSDLVYPEAEHPLRDPRVRVHLEDGRFFLLATDRQFDLITGEPPPPRHAGVGNLYSQEYFELVRSRLRDGGVVTYWLTVHQLLPRENQAVLAGFCAAFPNCSLWSGNGLEWMMVGVKNPSGPAAAEDFARQWRNPRARPELEALGFPDPSSLGPTFIADGDRLRAFIGDTPPLVDEFPQRIASQPMRVGPEAIQHYHDFMADPESAQNFFTSAHLAAYWPDAYRTPNSSHSARRSFLLADHWLKPAYATFHATWTDPALAGFAAWTLGSDADAVAIANRALGAAPDALDTAAFTPNDYPHLVAAAISRRDVALADRAFARWETSLPEDAADRDLVVALRATLLFTVDERVRGNEQLERLRARTADDPSRRARVEAFGAWAETTYGLAQ